MGVTVRDLIESIRQMAEEGGAVPVPNPILVEMARAWLALDAAPVGESPSQMGTALVVRVPEGVHLKGQRIRLVPTHAAGGE